MIYQQESVRAHRNTLLAAAIATTLSASAFAAAPFEIVSLPDTQFYTAGSNGGTPAIFNAQTNWIVANKTAENIAFVSHMGDITDDGSNVTMWNNGLTAMNTLNGVVPYSSCFGNHDVHWLASNGDGVANCKTYFGDATHQGGSSCGGVAPNGLSFYQAFSAGSFSFINMNLNFNPDVATLDWADGVLKANANKLAIVSTHSYLQVGGALSTDGGTNIWSQSLTSNANGLVKGNSNVLMVLCGHNHGEVQRIDANSQGAKVVQMLADYQDYPNGGNGYLRKIQFDPDNGKINISTYSPSLGAYETDSNSQFSYNASFNAGANSIAINGLASTPKPGATFTNNLYTQNFDAFGTSGTALPTGWKALVISGAVGTYTAATGITGANVATAADASTQVLATWTAPNTPPKYNGQLINVTTATSGQALGTSPTSNAANVIELTMVNSDASPMSALKVKYDMHVFTKGVTNDGEANELPGLFAFYSTDGSTWTEITDLRLGMPATTTTGIFSSPEALITFPTPVASGDNIFIRWVDDNNTLNSPDAVLGIDNVQLTAVVPEPASMGTIATVALTTLLRRRRHAA